MLDTPETGNQSEINQPELVGLLVSQLKVGFNPEITSTESMRKTDTNDPSPTLSDILEPLEECSWRIDQSSENYIHYVSQSVDGSESNETSPMRLAIGDRDFQLYVPSGGESNIALVKGSLPEPDNQINGHMVVNTRDGGRFLIESSFFPIPNQDHKPR